MTGEAALLIGSYKRWSGLGLADLTIDDGDTFRVVAELCSLEGSEGPSGGAAGLLGGDRVGIFRQELVDVPRRILRDRGLPQK